jgi:TonB family protein
MMIRERRQFSRYPTSSSVFVNVDFTNGGDACDFSRGGLALDLEQPLGTHRFVTLGFGPLGSGTRIETPAEIAWTDESRKRAGFRFMNLPQSSYEVVENWLCGREFPHQKPTATDTAEGWAYSRDWNSGLLSPQQAAYAHSEAWSEFSPGFARGSGNVAQGRVAPPRAIKPDSVQDLRSLVTQALPSDAAASEPETSEPSKRTRVHVPEVLLTKYGRRTLLVRSLLLAMFVLLVMCFVFVASYPELLGLSSWSGSVNNVVSELRAVARGDSAGWHAGPKSASPAVGSEFVAQRNGGSSAKTGKRSSPSHESSNLYVGQNDEISVVDLRQSEPKSGPDSSNQMPVITILDSRHSKQHPLLTRSSWGHSRLLTTTIDFPADSPNDGTPTASMFVTQQISGAFPEEPLLLSYPDWMPERTLQGSVTVRATIAQDGSVREVRLVSGDPLLAKAVREAVKHWRYKPWIGEPASAQALIGVNFTVSTK